MTGSLADGVLRRDWSKINVPPGTFGPISTSERPRNRSAGSMPNERQLPALRLGSSRSAFGHIPSRRLCAPASMIPGRSLPLKTIGRSVAVKIAAWRPNSPFSNADASPENRTLLLRSRSGRSPRTGRRLKRLARHDIVGRFSASTSRKAAGFGARTAKKARLSREHIAKLGC